MPGRASHHGDQEAAFGERIELVGDGGVGRIGRGDELGRVRIGDVEEEDLALPLQHAEQAAGGQDASVRGESDVMGLVARLAGTGQGHGVQDLAVSG